LDVQVKHLEGHTAQVTIALETDKTQASKQKAARTLAKQIRIPGFRPGKAPYNVVLKTLGEETILQQAVEDMGDNVYKEALEQSEIEPGGVASLSDYREENGQILMVFDIPKQAEVDLGAYRDVRATLEPEAVTDEQVDDALQTLREENAVSEAVDREARLGDEVQMALHVKWWHDAAHHDHPEGEEHDHDHPEGEAAGHFHDLVNEAEATVVLHETGSKQELFPGFSEQVLGLKAGDEKTFSLRLPEDFENEDLAGQEVTGEIKIAEVRSRTLPELNDTFAETASKGEAPTLLELRVKTRQDLETAAEQQAKNKLFNHIMEEVIEAAQVQYHESLVQEYTDDILQQMNQMLQQQAGMQLQDYLRVSGKTLADLREEQREEVVKRIKRDLVMNELVRREALKVEASDIDTQITEAVAQFGEQAERFRRFYDTPEMRLQIASGLLSERLMERMIDIALGKIE